MRNTSIRKVTSDDASRLAGMLCADTRLRHDLSIPDDEMPTAADFLAKVESWEKRKYGETYAIVVDTHPVGIISVHPNPDDPTSGKVGYWVGSDHRDHGHCTVALQQLAAVAARHHMTTVSGTTVDANVASQRVWQKLHAQCEMTPEGKQRFTLPVKIANKDLNPISKGRGRPFEKG